MAADGKFGMNTDCDFYKLDYETLAVTHFNDAMLRGKYVAQPDPSTSPRATTRCTALS